jgi:hypothetical protein
MTNDLDHDLEPPEDGKTAEWLRSRTPVPSPNFRGALGRYLARRDPGVGPRPPRLRLMSAACLGTGALVLVVAALQATGSI